MKKTITAILAGAAMTAGAILSPVTAQQAGIAGNSGTTLQQLSASDISSMLSEYDISSQLRASQRAGTAPVLEAQTPGGAKFLVGFFQCADATNANGCLQLMISTAQPSAGVSFEDLNQFNGMSSVTTVVYEPSRQILIFGRNLFTPGGLGRENVKLQVALFLEDMGKFTSSRSGTTASVSFNKSPSLRTKIDSLTETKTSAPMHNAALMTEDGSLEVEIAIANSVNVDYSIDVSGTSSVKK